MRDTLGRSSSNGPGVSGAGNGGTTWRRTRTVLPDGLIAALEDVRSQLTDLPKSVILREFEGNAASARNFLHYLAFRRVDLRSSQELLARMGLSSLGHAESHVLENLDAVLGHLYRMAGRTPRTVRRRTPRTAGPRRSGCTAMRRCCSDPPDRSEAPGSW